MLVYQRVGTPSQIRRVEAPYVSFLWERPTPIQFSGKYMKVFYIGRIIHVDKWYLSCHVFTLILILQYMWLLCASVYFLPRDDVWYMFGVCLLLFSLSVRSCNNLVRMMFMYSFRAWKACTTQEHLAYSYRSAWASTGKTRLCFHTGSGATRLFPQRRV